MDYKRIEELTDRVRLHDIKNFELKDVFENGQCFRWNESENGNYIGVVHGKVLELERNEDYLDIINITKSEFEDTWENYFTLDIDYDDIKSELKKLNDSTLNKGLEFGKGLRLLKQDPFETTISFIISANNRIPRIKDAVEKISKRYGDEILYNGEVYYAFPSIEQLAVATVEDLQSCNVGFRGKYIYDTVQRLNNRELNLQEIEELPDDECHKELKEFKGVGDKVADCIMLFSMKRFGVFPSDVWVKKIMEEWYGCTAKTTPKVRSAGMIQFGELAGVAQQYLFYYARETKME